LPQLPTDFSPSSPCLAQNRKRGKVSLAFSMGVSGRAGELLREMQRNGARRKRGQPKVISGDPILPALPDLGISPDESSQWQALAAATSKNRTGGGTVSLCLPSRTQISTDRPALPGRAVISPGARKGYTFDTLSIHPGLDAESRLHLSCWRRHRLFLHRGTATTRIEGGVSCWRKCARAWWNDRCNDSWTKRIRSPPCPQPWQ
jgi:hypothetical protein